MRTLYLLLLLWSFAPIAQAATVIENWQVIHEAFFAGRPVEDATSHIQIEAPSQAEDASLVPIGFKVNFLDVDVQKIYLFTDANPILHTATFIPAKPVRDFALFSRIRLDKNSVVRVVAETTQGKLFMATRAIKTPGGGCGGGGYADEALLREQSGKMKVQRVLDDNQPDNSQLAFHIKHPMRTGFERTPQGYYAKAWYINHLQFKLDEKELLTIEVGPGISADPYFQFSVPQSSKTLSILAKDNEGKSFQQNMVF